MANLEAYDAASLRKSRHNSMMLLKAASHLSLNDEIVNVEQPESHQPESQQHESQQHELLGKSHIEGKKHIDGHGNRHEVKTTAKEAMVMCVSAIYGKLLIVIGIGFPIAKTLSHDLPLIYYNSFYLYLYFGSILFIIYAYISLLSSFHAQFNNMVLCIREFKNYVKPLRASIYSYIIGIKKKVSAPLKKHVLDESEDSYKSEYSNSTEFVPGITHMEEGETDYKRSKYVFTEDAGHGSMYLKMGTIIFGIGSMIYSGLEFGHYFELRADCSDILMAITPAARMLFTFLQMYFIFLNSRVSISRHTIIARFGIMHMVATNLCIWLNVLVEETKHTIHHVTHLQHDGHHDDHGVEHGSGHHEDDHVMADSHHYEKSLDHSDYHSSDPFHGKSGAALSLPGLLLNQTTTAVPLEAFSMKLTEGLFNPNSFHNLVKRSIDDMEGCRIINLMGNMVNSSAPLLFPCTIEYSLLCASVLYVMWKNVQMEKSKQAENYGDNHLSQFIARKVRHLYSVDCGRASRGLFTGIFVLVLTLISLILFYVLVSNKNFKYYGILSANISEILIYSVGIVTTLIGMIQVRQLGFIEEGETELDNVLLVIAQCGVYMFNIFTLIGGYFSTGSMSAVTLVTALVTLVQATLQTLYILDGSRRCCRTTGQLDRKPGREIVTFLLMLNLSMWLFSTFQTSRAYLHKAQQDFYGVWAWTIINHVSMPLGIFYRFHATVCLGEIWKRAYKLKAED